MSPLNVEIKNKVAIVTMDYPPVNALTADSNNEIIKTFDSFQTKMDVNVVILTAVGSRAFCAGVDLNSRLPTGNSQNDPSAHYRRARETFNSIYECAVPVIGAMFEDDNDSDAKMSADKKYQSLQKQLKKVAVEGTIEDEMRFIFSE